MTATTMPAVQRRTPVAARERTTTFQKYEWIFQLLFILAHTPLGLLLRKGGSAITWHARGILIVGVLIALTTRRWERVAYVAAYITGAEVFWRMRRADTPWEYGKYAVVLILVIAIVRMGAFRKGFLPGLYFGLLLPSAGLTLMLPDIEEARSMVSFNLSGPLALAVCATFFSALRFSKREMQWLYVSLLAPVYAIAIKAAEALSLNMPETFGNDSNRAASGGFGPNQVSAVLGLGILCAVLYLMLGAANVVATAAFGALILFLFRQCAITFSRGGLYMAVGGILAAAYYLVRDKRQRRRFIGAMVVLLPIVFFVVWPRLEELTSGAITERFSDVNPTGRDRLALADLKSWGESPVLGVGPGLGAKNRIKVAHTSSAHTEYTRVLAEHGILGLFSLLVLGVMVLRTLRAAPTRMSKALCAAMLSYSLLGMAVDGMRLAAAGFAFGLAGVKVVEARRRVAAAPTTRKVVPLRAGGGVP
jgi:O-antigen ligase